MYNSILKGFVLLVNLPVLFLAFIVDNIANINLCSCKKCFGDVWVCVVSYSDLLALEFNLLKKRQFRGLFFCLDRSRLSAFLLLNTELYVPLASHFLKKLSLVLFVSLFLNPVKLELSFYRTLFCKPFCLLHLFRISYSVSLFFFNLLLLFLFSHLSSLFSQFL